METKSIEINNEQINFIIQKLKNEVEENEDLISDLKDTTEKEVWKDENKFIKNLISDLKQNSQLVIQNVELTAEQEDYMIESQLEEIRMMRDLK